MESVNTNSQLWKTQKRKDGSVCFQREIPARRERERERERVNVCQNCVLRVDCKLWAVIIETNKRVKFQGRDWMVDWYVLKKRPGHL